MRRTPFGIVGFVRSLLPKHAWRAIQSTRSSRLTRQRWWHHQGRRVLRDGCQALRGVDLKESRNRWRLNQSARCRDFVLPCAQVNISWVQERATHAVSASPLDGEVPARFGFALPNDSPLALFAGGHSELGFAVCKLALVGERTGSPRTPFLAQHCLQYVQCGPQYFDREFKL
jgi:hypothetical protein